MANTKSAKKRARQTIRRTARNYTVRSEVKTAVRSAREAIQGKTTELGAALKDAVSTLAKAANKGVMHKRSAARRISRLMAKARTAAAGTTAAAAAPAAKKAAAKKKPAARASAKK
jgi:small subunit ribosomal protein S20